jgi:ankyrin repeat protein
MLIEHVVDVTVMNMFGSTPLHWVSRLGHGHPEIACLFLEHGANVEDVQDKYEIKKHTLTFGIATLPSHPHIIRIAGRAFGTLDVVQLLLNHGADPHASDRDLGGWTSLALQCLRRTGSSSSVAGWRECEYPRQQ